MPVEVEAPPAELVEFDSDDWVDHSDPLDVDWLPAFWRWCAARETWAGLYPGSLGGWDRRAFELRSNLAMMQARPLAATWSSVGARWAEFHKQINTQEELGR